MKMTLLSLQKQTVNSDCSVRFGTFWTAVQRNLIITTYRLTFFSECDKHVSRFCDTGTSRDLLIPIINWGRDNWRVPKREMQYDCQWGKRLNKFDLFWAMQCSHLPPLRNGPGSYPRHDGRCGPWINAKESKTSVWCSLRAGSVGSLRFARWQWSQKSSQLSKNIINPTCYSQTFMMCMKTEICWKCRN